jgi:ribonuclease Z
VVISHQNGHKISYSGDTRPSAQFIKKAEKSTLMIHEATFNDTEFEDAADYRHCTV